MASNILQWLKEEREKLKLVGYFLVLLTFSLPVARMVGEGYEQGALVNAIFRLPMLLEGVTLDQVAVFGFGLYVGLLLLMTIDHKKRVQAALLWIATILAVLALGGMGIFLPNVNLLANVPWMLGGIALGVVVGGGRELVEFDSVQTTEFRRASEGVYFLLMLIALISFLEVHLVYPDLIDIHPNGVEPIELKLAHENPNFGFDTNGLIVNAVSTGVFIGVVNRFITYDADHDFFLLGPRASGKSLFLIGAYLEALDRARTDEQSTPLHPSQDLMSMIEELDRQDTGWIVEATGRGVINELSFQYVHGSVFPTNVELSSIDYAGEYLSRLPDAISGAVDDEDMDTTLRRLVENIDSADTLVLMIDVERFMNNEPLEISEYFSILQAAEDKNAMLVATKADHLAEEFQDSEGLEPHMYYDEFVDFVNQRLRQNENVNSLVTQVGGSEIHPVYYQTKVDEQGNKVPRRDESGSVLTVGYDELLDKLGRY